MKVTTKNQAIKALAEVPTPFARIAAEIIEHYNGNNRQSMKPLDLIQFANVAVAVTDFLRLNRQMSRTNFVKHMVWGPSSAFDIYKDLPGWNDFYEVYSAYFS